jgi:uncharacterized membrane protein
MKQFIEIVLKTFFTGLLILVTVYLSVLLLLKAMSSVAGLARPLANLLPEWLPAEHILSLLLVLIVCFLIGIAVRTPAGRAIQERIEKSFFERMPGYALFRSLTQRLAGKGKKTCGSRRWPRLRALVPAFIIEELADWRFTVFVPSVPTPFAGAVYILSPEHVHPLDVPFTQAIQSVSRWGSGSKELVEAMKTESVLK